ncbi:hypothetical protein DL98DRAFT_542929 [Cadophora sp. DSE1049]|nr:hypothetical protein DL98DRAFT_542929 [Cadophora sp. DSE1049]
MSSLKLIPVNHSNESGNLLTLSAPVGTDITGRPGVTDGTVKAYQFGSPISTVSIPSSKFRRARVTFTFPSTGLEWDQAGLLFLRPHRDLPKPSAANRGDEKTAPAFAKIALENFQDSTYCSVSASNGTLPEWSLWPVPQRSSEHHKITLEIVKHGAMLIAFLVDSKKQQLFRAVPWCFDHVEKDEPNIWVGIFVSRPDLKSETKEPLSIQFTDFEVETENGIVRF